MAIWRWDNSFCICLFIESFSFSSNFILPTALFLLLIWFLLVIVDLREEAWFFKRLIKSLSLFIEFLLSRFCVEGSILNSDIRINFSFFWGDVVPGLGAFEKEFFNLWPIDELCPEGIRLFLLILLWPLWLHISLLSFIFFLWYKLSPLNVFSTLLLGIFLPNEFLFLREELLLSLAWVVFAPTILAYY